VGLGALALRWRSAPAPMPQPGAATTALADVAPPLEAAHRRSRLRIEPGDAAVEIDGQAARPIDGFVEIAGPPGSIHKVRLTKGTADVTTEAVVAEDGVRPQKVSLDAAPSATALPAGSA